MKFLDLRSFAYGGTASVCAEFGTFPLDTAKTRLMVQGQKQTATEIVAYRYNGMCHAFIKICMEEGYRSLFKGASICAGVASAAACNPIDVIKSRMMNQHYNKDGAKSGLYTSSWDCALQSVRAEGFRALWKGLVPNCMRLGPWNIVFFLTLERLKTLDDTVSSLEASDIEGVLGKSQEIAAVSLEIVDGDVCLKDLRAN